MADIARHPLQSAEDFRLGQILRSDRHVQKVIGALEEAETKNHQSVRRQLLATSLRLTPSMLPSLDEMLSSCRETLKIDIPIEAYVYSSPQFNAACVKPEDGKLFLMFSSALLETFEGSELRFVVGHELGHYLFGHHDIPTGYILKGEAKPEPELALRLFSWSRFAEISADRAGMACANDKDGCARALFRLSAGLRTQLVQIDIEKFAAQVDDMQAEDDKPGAGAPPSSWFSTHPFSPLRVKALELFSRSADFTGEGMDSSQLEVSTKKLLSLMAPNYLEEKSAEAESMRRLLFAASLSVAAASGGIEDAEIAVFEKFFGAKSYNEKLNIEAIRADLPNRAAAAKKSVSVGQLMHVLRDVVLVAQADGHVGPLERKEMDSLAELLGISKQLVVDVLHQPKELD